MEPEGSQANASCPTEQTFADLEGYMTSAVLIAALEHGLFWQLQTGPMKAETIAERLGLPSGRCRYWLQYLSRLGYLLEETEGYILTEKTKIGILQAYSQGSWSLLAQEAREASPPFHFFSTHLASRESLWLRAGMDPKNYVENMIRDPDRARRFTCMLYELHQDLANEIAARLDFTDVQRVMDLGGGSGVVSAAILQRHPEITSLVVDIHTVCAAGEELAAQAGLSDRLQFHPADFLKDDLPEKFHLVLECDVGVYDESLFDKIRKVLTIGGRFVIVDQFAPAPHVAPEARLSWALQGSIRDPEFRYKTPGEIVELLEGCGFSSVSVQPFSILATSTIRFHQDLYLIEAALAQ